MARSTALTLFGQVVFHMGTASTVSVQQQHFTPDHPGLTFASVCGHCASKKHLVSNLSEAFLAVSVSYKKRFSLCDLCKVKGYVPLGGTGHACVMTLSRPGTPHVLVSTPAPRPPLSPRAGKFSFLTIYVSCMSAASRTASWVIRLTHLSSLAPSGSMGAPGRGKHLC